MILHYYIITNYVQCVIKDVLLAVELIMMSKKELG